jgi:hypothetical protein
MSRVSATLSLVTYYAPATSLQSAAGAIVALTFLTLLVSTLYIGFQVYHKERTHFMKPESDFESEKTHIQNNLDEESAK